MVKIDEIDREIVNLLMEDGRMNAAEMARRLEENISERAIRYRIHRMLEEHIIHISAVVNPRSLGYQVIADVFIEVEPGQTNLVAQRLAEHESISYVACSIGERDISAQVIARDNAEVYAIVTNFIGNLHGVRKLTTSIVPLTMKDVYDWRIPQEACQPGTAQAEPSPNTTVDIDY
ncbi:MAG: Lrp/AsnC family transcriptional regulator [Chloroflexota bacterium]